MKNKKGLAKYFFNGRETEVLIEDGKGTLLYQLQEMIRNELLYIKPYYEQYLRTAPV